MAVIKVHVMLSMLLLFSFLCVYLCCAYMLKYRNLLYQRKEVNTFNYQFWSGPMREEANIMFVDMTCALQQKQHRLSPSHVCAIESAARQHPTHQIYVYHTCNTDVNSDLPIHRDAYMRHFHRYPNVFFLKLNVSQLVEGTMVAGWWASRPDDPSQWQEVVGLVLLWKYGGIYMDLDFVVIRSLSELPNFIGSEGERLLANAFAFHAVGPGHQQVEEFLREITNSGHKSSDQGHNLLTRVMLRSCNVSKVSQMTTERCNGIRILPPIFLYPNPEISSHLDASDNRNTLTASLIGDERTKAVHVRSQFSMAVGSDQVYAILASKFCPLVYKLCDRTLY